MPFAETHVMEEKKRFIEEAHRSARSFAAVCDRGWVNRCVNVSGGILPLLG